MEKQTTRQTAQKKTTRKNKTHWTVAEIKRAIKTEKNPSARWTKGQIITLLAEIERLKKENEKLNLEKKLLLLQLKQGKEEGMPLSSVASLLGLSLGEEEESKK